MANGSTSVRPPKAASDDDVINTESASFDQEVRRLHAEAHNGLLMFS